MNLSTKQEQTHRHREQTCGCPSTGVGGRDELGVWGWQMQTITYRMDKEQGPTYSTGNYIQYPVIWHNGKEYKKKNLYMCIAEPLCCTAKTGTAL